MYIRGATTNLLNNLLGIAHLEEITKKSLDSSEKKLKETGRLTPTTVDELHRETAHDGTKALPAI